MIKKSKNQLVVIGGGPAGMMAAISAAESGAQVVLLEKNSQLGIKLLLTGHGRCNFTNAEPNLKKLISAYGPSGKFLYPAFNNFSNQEVIRFFQARGIEYKIEDQGRVLTADDKSQVVVDCLKKCLVQNRVNIKYNFLVREIIFHQNKIIKIISQTGEEIAADNFIIATGGQSYPATGSTGDAYQWLQKMGHKIISPQPSLVPLVVKEKIIKKLEGLSLKDAVFSLWSRRQIFSLSGSAVFTAQGLSGPSAFQLSQKICRLNNNKDLKIKINFRPNFKIEDILAQPNRQFKNSLDQVIPPKLIPVIIDLSKINPQKKVSEINKEEKQKIINLIQQFELTFKSLAGFDQAIVTAGGVDLKEIDPQTMRSKIIDNLYLAGEIINLDGPTGGYNLQLAWSTGRLAGQSAIFFQ